MEHTPLSFGIGLCLLVLGISAAQAQTPAYQGEALALHIPGLSSDDRDALTQELRSAGDYRVVFACVPAGLLVIGRTDTPLRANERLDLLPRLQERFEGRSVEVREGSLEVWEDLCSAVRD